MVPDHVGYVNQIPSRDPVTNVDVSGSNDVGGLPGLTGQLKLGLVLAPGKIVLDGVQGDPAVVAGCFELGVGIGYGRSQVVAPPILIGRCCLAPSGEGHRFDFICRRLLTFTVIRFAQVDHVRVIAWLLLGFRSSLF